MTRSPLETTRLGYEAFARGGVDAVADVIWSPEIVWDMTPTGIPGLGVYTGFDEIRKFFDDWVGSFEGWEFEVEELEANGENVVAVLRQHGRGRESGADVALEFAQISTVRGGRTVRVETYLDPARAREAAGLTRPPG